MAHRFLGIACTFLLTASAVWATQPVWWTDAANSTAIIDGNFTGNTSITNYEPLNIGQLKNVATKAKVYFDNQLAGIGGAGTNVTALVGGFTHNSTTDYAPANLGQLKAVAKPFYDRLIAIGFNTNAFLIAQGFPGTWAYNYPWNPSTATSVNYAPANLGQLKMVFSFDLSSFTPSSSLDAGGDGLPDAWQEANGLNPLNTDPNSSSGENGDFDGDGMTNLQEYELGLNPETKDAPDVALGVMTPLM